MELWVARAYQKVTFTFFAGSKPHISLLLRPYEGYAVARSYATAERLIEPTGVNESGITLSPLHVTIPPHGEASVFASISGTVASIQKEAKIEAYALGFLSVKDVLDGVSWREPPFCPQMRINLTATVAEPKYVVIY